MKWPNPIIGGASFAGNVKPKSDPNSLPPKHHEKTPNKDHTIAEKKNCLGFGKKLSSTYFSILYTMKIQAFHFANISIALRNRPSSSSRNTPFKTYDKSTPEN